MKKGGKKQQQKVDLFDVKMGSKGSKASQIEDFLDKSQMSAIHFLGFEATDFLKDSKYASDPNYLPDDNTQQQHLHLHLHQQPPPTLTKSKSKNKQNQDMQQDSLIVPSIQQQYKDKTIIYKQILNDLTELLSLPFANFWATLKYNQYFQKSLDTFLRYSRKQVFNEFFSAPESDMGKQAKANMLEKLEKDKNHQLMQQIYQRMFLVLNRIALPNFEDQAGSVKYQCFQIVFDNWLMDFPKFYDIIEIYCGVLSQSDDEKNQNITNNANSNHVRRMIHNVLGPANPTYHDKYLIDFKEDLSLQCKTLIEPMLNELRSSNKRSHLKYQTASSKEEFQKRLTLIYLGIHVTEIYKRFFDFFPLEFVSEVAFHPSLSILIENLFYQCKAAKKEWMFFERTESSVVALLNKLMENVIMFFVNLFEFLKQNSKLQQQAYTHKVYTKMSDIICNFGKVLQQPLDAQTAKHKEERNHDLLEQIQLRFDVLQFVKSLNGKEIMANEENQMLFQATLSSLVEAHSVRIQRKASQQENNANPSINDNEKGQQSSILEQEQAQIQEQEYSDLDMDEEDEEDAELERLDLKNGKIKYSEIFYKKDKGSGMEQSLAARQQMAEIIKQQMSMQDEYDDEFDDTIQQVYRKIIVDKRPESDSSSSDSEERRAKLATGNDKEDSDSEEEEGRKNYNQNQNYKHGQKISKKQQQANYKGDVKQQQQGYNGGDGIQNQFQGSQSNKKYPSYQKQQWQNKNQYVPKEINAQQQQKSQQSFHNEKQYNNKNEQYQKKQMNTQSQTFQQEITQTNKKNQEMSQQEGYHQPYPYHKNKTDMQYEYVQKETDQNDQDQERFDRNKQDKRQYDNEERKQNEHGRGGGGIRKENTQRKKYSRYQKQ